MIEKQRLEAVLDGTAVLASVLFLSLAWAGVLLWSDVDWSLGLFTGWMLRHFLN